MCTKFESIWTCLTVQKFSNLKKDRSGFERVSWGYTILHDMVLGKIINNVMCDMIEFSWIFMEIFPVEIFQILEMGRNGFEGISWGYTILHDMRLGKIIKHVICDMLEFSWIFMKIFPVEIFKSLKWAEMVFGGFVQYFDHDHVLKLIYMENICPLSLPNFSQLFLKLKNNFNLLKTISGLKKNPLNKIGK